MINLTKPKISIVVVFYNMQREASRTLFSLSSEYQSVSEKEYEVIVIDNGSTEPLKKEDVENYGENFRYYFIENASPSPSSAINFGVEQAKGKMLGLMIDGARILTPRIINYALRAFRAYQYPLVVTLAWHLGDEVQHLAIQKGYNQEVEDDLLKTVDWQENGYELFKISTLAASSSRGWFFNMAESNCFFMLKKAINELGGFDEDFNAPGGGFTNLDFYYRACEMEGIELVVLLGEGTFHQFHGGAATGIPHNDPKRVEWRDQYRQIRGDHFKLSTQSADYWGHLPKEAIPFMKLSIDKKTENQ